MKYIIHVTVCLLIVQLLSSAISPNSVAATTPTNNDQLSLNLNKVEPARKELILQKEGSQNVARTSLNFELFREGMLLENPRKPLDVVFVFDKSASMNVSLQKNISRLQKAKEAMQTAATVFTAANSDRINKDRFGLVEFNSKETVRKFNGKDLTSDINQISEVVKTITAPEGTTLSGTNYSSSLQAAEQLLKKHKDSSREQVIIFLTDGEPTVLYTKEKPLGNYEKVNWCFWGYCDTDPYNYELIKNYKDTTDTEFIIYSNGSYRINPNTFYHDGNKIRFASDAKVYVENHAQAVAANITKKESGIILYPVGFGEASINYLDKLASKTSNGESMAIEAGGTDLNQVFEALVNEIDTPSLNNVGIEIKIPNNVSVEEAPGVKVETRGGQTYAIVTPSNGRVQYSVGEGPGLVSVPNLPLKFSAKGDYFFKVKWKYTDIKGNPVTKDYSQEVKVSVQDQVAPSFELNMSLSSEAPRSNDIIRLQKSNVKNENFDSFIVDYTIKPYGKLANGSKGSLKNIKLKQKLPAGLKADLKTGMVENQLDDGSTEIIYNIDAIQYNVVNGKMEFSKETERLSFTVKGIHSIHAQPLPDPIITFVDNNSNDKTAAVTNRPIEKVEMVIKLVDSDMNPVVEYRGNHAGNISKYNKGTGQLLASITLRDDNNETFINPIFSMEFGDGKKHITITYANGTTREFPLTPKLGVRLKDSGNKLSIGDNGEYTFNQKAEVFFDKVVPGYDTQSQYEVRFKKPGTLLYSQWQTINPTEYQYLVEEYGKTLVQVRADGGFIRASFDEVVTLNYNGVSGFSLLYQDEMYVGETQQIESIFDGLSGLIDLRMIWSSLDSQIASVDSSGVVTAKKPGVVTISAALAGQGLTKLATIKVVDIPDYTLEFKKPLYTTKVDQPLNLQGQVRINPPHLNGRFQVEVVWQSSDPSIFAIEQNGHGRGVSKGVVMVTVTSTEDSSISASTIVMVEEKDAGGNNPSKDFRW
ncbi:von Willebrand factor type A domain protein [Bacillus sp. THAF10]|uniref:VWA domain-containing protein n=1 Tax=Bacillus sp. THAF10 TaxID=2587848 RepID=UPI0012AA6AB8|nr:VWA domain-containing protein [Bacillus sp. THAF10]QFT90068.1 von Willebrand factor type A domain protein [Bacillus sp. THAF10]